MVRLGWKLQPGALRRYPGPPQSQCTPAIIPMDVSRIMEASDERKGGMSVACIQHPHRNKVVKELEEGPQASPGTRCAHPTGNVCTFWRLPSWRRARCRCGSASCQAGTWAASLQPTLQRTRMALIWQALSRCAGRAAVPPRHQCLLCSLARSPACSKQTGSERLWKQKL